MSRFFGRGKELRCDASDCKHQGGGFTEFLNDDDDDDDGEEFLYYKMC